MPDLSAFVPKGMSLRRTHIYSGTQTVRFGTDAVIWSHAQQSDGKIIIGGQFSTYNSVSTSGIARIDPTTGELDTTFTTNIGTGTEPINMSRDVYSVVIQPDGKILASGLFDAFNGVVQQGLVRLNSDGTVDTAFNANVAYLFDRTSGDNYALSIALQSDGKIILGGVWTNGNGLLNSSQNPSNIYYLARLNSDGTLDTTFSSNGTTYPNNIVYKVVVQSDDKILVGGSFTSWTTSGGSVSVSGFARLNANGTLDTTFNTALGTGKNTGAVRALAVQSDGSVIFGGDFTSFNGTSCDIVRVSSTGTFDTTFNTNVGTGVASGAYIFSISVQSDGDILVGGNFLSWNGTTVGEIVRLNSDGTRDTAFTTANGTGAISTGQIRTLSQLSSGDIFIAGDTFSSWNGTLVDNITTLTSAGAKTTTFLPKPDIVFAIVVGAGGGSNALASQIMSGGGGAGAIVQGLVPFTATAVVGAGSSGNGEASQYSTLYAQGGSGAIGESNGTASTNGAGASGGAHKYTSASGSQNPGGSGSVLFTSVGGSGGTDDNPSAARNSAGSNGGTATSGGGGGAASYSPGSGTSITVFGGAGGSGFVGGGGGPAGTDDGSRVASMSGGAGGSGVYSGGTVTSISLPANTQVSSGGGGGGLLGAGGNGVTGTTSAAGGVGGLGGGGAGGSINTTASGGTGCVLIYW